MYERLSVPQVPPKHKLSLVDGRHVLDGGVREKGRPVDGRHVLKTEPPLHLAAAFAILLPPLIPCFTVHRGPIHANEWSGRGFHPRAVPVFPA